MSFYSWRPYVPVAQRRAKAHQEMAALSKKGKNVQPIELDGRRIAASFWGKGWCDHLESFSDFENRLPRGRTYVRNGSVCHLEIKAGCIEAFVSGSELYKVAIKINPLQNKTWGAIKARCQGKIASVLELLQGRLSDHVMEVVSDQTQGLFPRPNEIELMCSCPDWATMCKHVAAVLYGVGSRLDHQPELLFLLRGVDAQELISAELALPTGTALAATEALAEGGLAEIFGIDLDTGGTPKAVDPGKRRKASKTRSKAIKGGGKVVPRSETPFHKARKAKPAAARKNSGPVFDPKAPTGQGVARLRKRTKLSMADFAHALGVSVPSVQRWESTPGALRLYARPLAALTRMQEEHVRK